jgi:hypothetical protein
MLDFGGDTGGSGADYDLIPNGTLVMGTISLEASKISQNGGRYYPYTISIDDGQPYERRKIWGNIMDPFFPEGCDEAVQANLKGNSEGACNMGKATVQRILELNTGAHPDKEGSYQINHIADLSGMSVAIRIKKKKGTDGYADKNEVAAFLSCHEKLPGYPDFQKIQSGNGAVENEPVTSFGSPQPVQKTATTDEPPVWMAQS